MVELPSGESMAERPSAMDGWARWAPLSGIAFAVLFLAAFFGVSTPEPMSTDKEWLDFFASSGNRAGVIVSAFLYLLAALCQLTFFSMLWSRIAAASRPNVPSPLPLIASGVSATCIALGGVMGLEVTVGMIAGMPEPSAAILRMQGLPDIPFIFVAGMFAMALAIASLSHQARQVGLFGGGLRTFGLVVAAITLASIFFAPFFVTASWFLVVSIVLLCRRPMVAAPPATASTSAR